ncbi:MAG: single-stranded DNA-binding protein [Defluviitaleaceae bacterium]|nr:single-stranded DNA-binding protein [Defluviitaleaceae bacterium]
MLNNVTIMGRLTANPEMRYTNTSSIAVASFSIAVNRRYSKEREAVADFFNVVAWKGTAEFVTKNFTKGQPICIEGRLQQRTWVDEATGTNRYAVEIVAEDVHFAGFKKEDGQASTANGVGDEDFDPYAGSVAA